MSVWTKEKKIKSRDGKHEVELCASPDRKFFRYYESIWKDVEGEELSFHPDGGYWTLGLMSGLYESLEDCEKGARSELGWRSEGN